MRINKNNNIYDCKTVEKLIPLYLANALAPYELEQLLTHIKRCASCKEELTIQYLVSEGLEMVENSDNYDLLKGLEKRINDSMRLIKRSKVKSKIMIFLSAFIMIAVIASVVILIFF